MRPPKSHPFVSHSTGRQESMPPKRPIQLQAPVPSYEDEDQGSGSGSESDEGKSESEELISKNRTKDPSAPSAADDDGEDSGSGSEEFESESESGSHKPDPVKSGAGGVKRPAENEPKRARKKLFLSEEEENGAKKGEDQKKPLFQRLWSEDDEIVVLKGIRDYVAKYGINSLNDMKSFFDFIKNSLHVDVSRNQLKDKVHRLKKKFLNNASKEKAGKDRVFSKPHEQKIYDVSKNIWAPDGKLLELNSSKVNDNGGKSGPEQSSGARRIVEFWRGGVGVAALEHEILNDGLEYIEMSKRVELEDKWKALRVEECQLYLKKVELIQEQTTLVLEAIKAGDEEEED